MTTQTVNKNIILNWLVNIRRNKLDGPSYISPTNNYKEWVVNGKRHREDGPAVIFADGEQHWLLNNKHHREDGPATYTCRRHARVVDK